LRRGNGAGRLGNNEVLGLRESVFGEDGSSRRGTERSLGGGCGGLCEWIIGSGAVLDSSMGVEERFGLAGSGAVWFSDRGSATELKTFEAGLSLLDGTLWDSDSIETGSMGGDNGGGSLRDESSILVFLAADIACLADACLCFASCRILSFPTGGFDDDIFKGPAADT
jgi:hypothetical protein